MTEQHLYLSLKTVIEMLEDRGVRITSGVKNMAYSHFLKLYETFDNYSSVFDIEGVDIYGNRTIVKCVKDINDKKKGNVIGITNQNDSKSAKSELFELYEFTKQTQPLKDTDSIVFVICYGERIHNTHIQIEKQLVNGQLFHTSQLLFNITKHTYVPKHELLSIDEIRELKKKLNIHSVSQLPAIKDTDPVARYLNMKSGDVCRIHRPSPATKIHICYRVCIGDRYTTAKTPPMSSKRSRVPKPYKLVEGEGGEKKEDRVVEEMEKKRLDEDTIDASLVATKYVEVQEEGVEESKAGSTDP